MKTIQFFFTIMASLMTEVSVTSKKNVIRAGIKSILKMLPQEFIDEKSGILASKLYEHHAYINSNALCIYLSMGGEVQTYDIVQRAFADGKRVFIPKVTGKRSQDMFIFEVESYSQIQSFPKSKWGIPEPPMDLVIETVDGTFQGVIDTVIVPGVGFDLSCARIGHGKGYYDCFLERLMAASKELSPDGPAPTTIALALDEQIVEEVPIEPHDRYLDYVLTPTVMHEKNRQS